MNRKTIFLDRDGVINEEKKDYVKNLKEFKIIDGSLQAIKLLKKNNFRVVIITNQSAINRGLLSIEKLNEIHDFLKSKLLDLDTTLDGIYFCPHTPNENCMCRKPKPGLLQQAISELDINVKDSLMIGDSQTDIDAANKMGCKSILLNKNQNLLQVVKELLF
jgi:D-glycero-D-manno-heptose 1,7-bisphosphate phosphatase